MGQAARLISRFIDLCATDIGLPGAKALAESVNIFPGGKADAIPGPGQQW